MPLLTTDEVKADLRITHDAEDSVVSMILDGAESWVAQQYGLAFAETEYTERIDGGGFELWPLIRPVVSVSEIVDKQSNDAVIDVGDYFNDTKQIARTDGYRWEAGRMRFEVTYTAGYGGTLTAPPLLKLAVLRLTARAYRARSTQRFELSAGASINWSAFMESDVIDLLRPFEPAGA